MFNLFSYAKMSGKKQSITDILIGNKVVIGKQKLHILGRSKGEQVAPSYLNKEQQHFECITYCLKHSDKL